MGNRFFTICFFFNVFMITTYSQELPDGNHLTNFLLENKLDINDSLIQKDNDLTKYKAYFLGVEYSFQNYEDAVITLIQYLHRHTKMRKIVSEESVSFQDYMNAYLLRDNNDSFLLAISNFTTLNTFPKKVYDFINQFNKNKNHSDKISVHFIGEEYYYSPTLLRLKTYVSDKGQAPSEIEKSINTLRNFEIEAKKNKELSNFSIIDSLYKESVKYSDLYSSFLGSDFSDFQRILNGSQFLMKKTFQEKSNLKQRMNEEEYFELREKFMYENYLKLFLKYPNDVFFGYFHEQSCILKLDISYKRQVNWNSIASRLNTYNDSPAKDLVCSIKKISNYDFKYLFLNEGYEMSKEDKKRLNSSSDGTIFNLTGYNSPFFGVSQRYQYLMK